jgi:hypothetical protein
MTFLSAKPALFACCLTAAALSAPAFADKISHPKAVFAGLDKITGRIISFEVTGDETVQFGSLQVTPRSCFTRPPTEAPLTLGFVEVEEVSAKDESKKIFSGWMFAASPGLHGVEHPVYDVWLTDCKGGTTIIKEEVAAIPEEPRSGSQLRGSSPAPGTGLGAASPPRGTASAPASNQLPSGSQLPPRPQQQAVPQPTIVPSPLPPAQPSQQARPAPPQTLGGAPIPPANIGGNASAPAQLPGVRSPDIPVPPADIGRAQPRRAPSQTYFPTESNR